MIKRCLSRLAFMLMAAGILPALAKAAPFSGEMFLPHASDYSGDTDALSSWTTGPPELENPMPRPAGKMLADDCPSVDVRIEHRFSTWGLRYALCQLVPLRVHTTFPSESAEDRGAADNSSSA